MVQSVLFTIPRAGAEATEHFGMCDASAAVGVGPDLFVVANDEDNVLRVYRNDGDGAAIRSFDLAPFLEPEKRREADIEGAARVGDRVYWIASHGRNKNGKKRPTRQRFFAADVTLEGDEVTITPVGAPYKDLLDDLLNAPQLADFDLKAASKRAPKDAEALNIEGLCATPGGVLLIGFRNPIPDGKALLVPLENPQDVIEGAKATLGDPILLSLGGLGVRSIDYSESHGVYFIVAGRYDGGDEFRLYKWSGDASDDPESVEGVDFGGLSPEALVVYVAETTRIQVLSDDGTKSVDGEDCKDAPTEKMSFRSTRIRP